MTSPAAPADPFGILAMHASATDRTAVLRHDDTFAVFDLHGDIGAFGPSQQGLYHEDTRYLSRFRLLVNDRRPLLLSARVKDENELFGVDLTNPDIPVGADGRTLPRDLVHIFRARFIWSGAWHECLRLWNYGPTTVDLSLAFEYEADFADIFEVRGMARSRRGTRLETERSGATLRLGYRGLDDERRSTVFEWSETPRLLTDTLARFDVALQPQTPATLSVAIRCERDSTSAPAISFESAHARARTAIEARRAEFATIDTSSEAFDRWLQRSGADLRMLVSTTAHGDYPCAGVPWFSTPFGRDGLITALQTLWISPRIARGVLQYLAATQADTIDRRRDAEPGKILHEARDSEMARLGEVPFGRYYGSVDATPLFVVLAGAYFERTGDRAFLEVLWPHVQRALDWIDRFGDRDGDGFVEYARQSESGLIQQGWKDSSDSVFHADGTLVTGPIALCEVQGYVYEARLRAARMAEALHDDETAQRQRAAAERLRLTFEDRFWCEEESIYAIALDGDKRPCRVRTSNAGHCLFSGIVSAERARRVADTLTGSEMFSGWGVRTLSTGERRYNPMSYHNGSVWPHDNGIIAAGFSRYGLDDLMWVPFRGLFEASLSLDRQRLPELFCGFHRRPGEGPTLYPVACAPQAWSSGVAFHLLQSCLRLSVDCAQRVLITQPALPPFLTYVRLSNLELPFGSADVVFERAGGGTKVKIVRQRGGFAVHIGDALVGRQAKRAAAAEQQKNAPAGTSPSGALS